MFAGSGLFDQACSKLQMLSNRRFRSDKRTDVLVGPRQSTASRKQRSNKTHIGQMWYRENNNVAKDD